MRSHRPSIKVLTVGPDINDLGGISAILRTYREVVPGFTFAPTNSRHGTLRGALVLLWTLSRLPFYRLGGYKVVHAHGASGKSFTRKRIVLTAARMLGFKTIFHCHGGGFREYSDKVGREVMKGRLSKFDSVVGLTPQWNAFFSEELRLPSVTTIRNVVKSPDRPVSRTPRRADEPLRALFLGKICAQKGVYDLLEAANRRRDDFKGRLKIVIAGNGESGRLTDMINRLQLGDMIEYAGGVFGEAKDRLLRDSELLLLPSYIEGLPITLLEAGAYSMASLTTPVGGIPGLIKDGENGTLVQPGDISALADALLDYINNPAKTVEQGKSASHAVRDHLPEAINQSLINLYNSLDPTK